MTTEPQAKDRQLGKFRQWEQAMSKLYINFQDYSKDARKEFNDEDIHQARVNSRKLLTLLSILDPGHTATADLYDSFKQAQKKLGRVRDADVLIGSFEARRKAAKAAGDKKTAKLLKAVIEHQKDTRKAARKKLRKALPKLSGQALEVLWTPFIETGLEPLAAKKDANVAMRELEVAFEQKKKLARPYSRVLKLNQKKPSKLFMSCESPPRNCGIRRMRLILRWIRNSMPMKPSIRTSRTSSDSLMTSGYGLRRCNRLDAKSWMSAKSGLPSPIRCGQRYWRLFIRTGLSLLLRLSPQNRAS